MNLPSGEKIRVILQGEFAISSDPKEVISTILGSCVSAFLRDPVSGVGGLNHFLLPDSNPLERQAVKYGLHAMELLINNLIHAGAQRDRLQAKLFGGGRMMPGLSDIGISNIKFAEGFLLKERIQYIGGSIGGDHGRKIRVWPVTGRVQQMRLPQSEVNQSQTMSATKPRNEVILF